MWWGLDDQQLSSAKNPRERKFKEKQLKAQKLRQLLRSVKDSSGNDDLVDRVGELVGLAALQDHEIDYLRQFQRDWERIAAHYPDRLESRRAWHYWPGCDRSPKNCSPSKSQPGRSSNAEISGPAVLVESNTNLAARQKPSGGSRCRPGTAAL